jgi:hypothetical protein
VEPNTAVLFPLFLAPHRQVLPQLLKAEAIGVVVAQDRLDDGRRDAVKVKRAADAGAGAVNGVGHVPKVDVLARCELISSRVT